jgi:hypothetical protein
MKYNDATDKTTVLKEVLPKYQAAWSEKQGLVGENGFFRRWYSPGQDKIFNSDDISHTVW